MLCLHPLRPGDQLLASGWFAPVPWWSSAMLGEGAPQMFKRLKMLFQLAVCCFWRVPHPLLGCRWLLQSLKSPEQKQGERSHSLTLLHSSVLEFTWAAFCVGKTRVQSDTKGQQTAEHHFPCGDHFTCAWGVHPAQSY